MNTDTNRRTPAEHPAPASTGREVSVEEICTLLIASGLNRPQSEAAADKLVWLFRRAMGDIEKAAYYRGFKSVAARELDVEAERRSPVTDAVKSMWPWEPSKMLDAQLRYIFELEQKVAALEAQVAAQAESAPVSTEQAGNAWGYRYPTADEIQADVAMESTALAASVSAMADSLDDCPLKDSLKVYAAVELAFKYGDAKYVEEVFNEVMHLGVSNGRK